MNLDFSSHLEGLGSQALLFVLLKNGLISLINTPSVIILISINLLGDIGLVESLDPKQGESELLLAPLSAKGLLNILRG